MPAAEAGIRALMALLRAASAETELAGSRASTLRGGISSEMPEIQSLIGKLGRSAVRRFAPGLGRKEPQEAADIESAVGAGAGKVLGQHDFFPGSKTPVIDLKGPNAPEAKLSQPTKVGKLKSLPADIWSGARQELRETRPRLKNIPLSRDLQKQLGLITKIEEQYATKFGGGAAHSSEQLGLLNKGSVESMGDRPSDRLVSRLLKSRFGVDVSPENVGKLRAHIIPRGGPYAEQGMLPGRDVRLDEPVGEEGVHSLGEFIPEDIKDRPESFSQGLGSSLRGESSKADISAALDKLTEKQRNAVLGYYGEEKSQVDLATELGISQKNVNKLLQKAVENLKKELKVNKARVRNIPVRKGEKL